MKSKTLPSNKLDANNAFTTFATHHPQEQSHLLILPREIRDKILNEIIVDDPEQIPDLALAFACKQLYNEAMNKVAHEFAVVNVAVQGFEKLARVLKRKVKTVNLNDSYKQLSEICWMNLVISKEFTGQGYAFASYRDRTYRFILIGLTNLRTFVKAIVLARRNDLPNDRDFEPEVRSLDYKLEFSPKKHDSAHENLKHTLREEQLLQPFFDFFWSGFKDFSVKHAVSDDLARKLVRHVAKDKWKSPEELIATLNQGREEGKAAYVKEDLIAAHKIWKAALDLKTMTGYTDQGYNFNVNRLGTAYGAKLDEVAFHLWSNLAAVLLKFAALPDKTHKEKMNLAGDAHQACVFAMDFSQMRNFVPSNPQIGKVYYRKAQALRMRGCLRGNLKEAEKCLAKAMKLCPKDPALKAEAKEIEKTMRNEMACGNFKASLEKEHGSGCHCGC